MKWVVVLLMLAAGPSGALEEARRLIEDISADIRTLDYD
jgi:hypothetical protein